MNMIMQNLNERLRPLLGCNGWDYCVIWKFNEDQRLIELVGCCCSGSDQDTQTNGGQELLFPVYPALVCRDTMQHPRANSCDLLALLPSSLPLDTGIYAQALISNQPVWLNSSANTDSSGMERDRTRVLVPSAGGLLIELFVSKDVSKDQQVIDFITSQCNIVSHDHNNLLSASCNASFTLDTNNMSTEIQPLSFLGNENEGNDHQNNYHNFQHPPVSPAMTGDHDSNLPYDISVDRIRLGSPSPMNFLHQVTYNSENTMSNGDNNNVYLDQQGVDVMEELENMEQQGVEEQDSVRQDSGRGVDHSVSDCSELDDEGDTNYRRRTGKGPQSKNLLAERRRRKKLNDRLYRLRSLVPNISKMDKAAIIGDAIEFVQDLQRQEKELQDELEQHSNDEDDRPNHNNFKLEILNQIGTTIKTKPENNGFHVGSAAGIGNVSKQNQDSDSTNDRGQQMEPQVGVTKLDGNEFFVTVFCEQTPGGFVRLMEALDTLGLEVTNANVTSFRSLVSNVFKVEKKDSEIVEADQVRDSLLEITRNPTKGWRETAKTPGNGSGLDHFDLDHQHLQNYHTSSYHLQHLYK